LKKMTKKNTDRTYPKRRELDVAFYRAGWLDAEAKYKSIIDKQKISNQRIIECVKTSNVHLWNEIRSLDHTCPIDYIIITLPEAEDILITLRQAKDYKNVKKIRSRLKAAKEILRKVYDRFIEDIKERQEDD